MKFSEIVLVSPLTIFPAITLAWFESAKAGSQISSFLGNDEDDQNFWQDSDNPDPLNKNDGEL